MLKVDATHIWGKYQQGVDWHQKNNLYSKTDLFYSMFQGDQWRYLQTGGEEMPQHNFIQPLCEHKIAMVAMNTAEIVYSSLNTGANEHLYEVACERLNTFAAKVWERKKLDAKVWDIVKQACIAGDAYIYFYNSELDYTVIDRTNIYLSDEQQSDIQKQKYIIIEERKFVEDVKDEARLNGIGEDEIANILADGDTGTMPANVKGNEKDGKCLSLLYLTKKKDGIYFARSTRGVIYQPEQRIDGLRLFPVASLVWSTVRGSARGIGEVEPLCANQILSNKLLARREINLKMVGFAKPVYLKDMVSNPEDIDKVGSKLAITGPTIQKVQDAFGYVNPAPIPSAAAELQAELITISRDLASAGDSATGNVNPEKASGAAIVAVRDQQAIATTPNVATFKQFVEDMAAIFVDTWVAYNPDGLMTDEEMIPPEILNTLEAEIRIDISPVNPYSKYAKLQFIETLMGSPIFQDTERLQEYHDLLPDDGVIPKSQIQDIIDRRRENEVPEMPDGAIY